MSENQPKEENTQNALSELLDDALKDFEKPDESNASVDVSKISEVTNFSASDNFLKESLEETMKSFMNSDRSY